MIKELTLKEVEYKFMIDNTKKDSEYVLPQYIDIYDKIDEMLSIDRSGYNLYIIDDFSKEKLENIIKYIRKKYKNVGKPQDICYVVGDDEKSPKCIFIDNGQGKLLKNTVEDIKKLYTEIIYNFYNNNKNKEIQDILYKVQDEKSQLIEDLIKEAHQEGFQIKSTQEGFNFIPLKDEELMSETDYDMLEIEEKQKILDKIRGLRIKSKNLLGDLKILEDSVIQDLKQRMKIYFQVETESYRGKVIQDFKKCHEAKKYILNIFKDIEENIIQNYSMNYEDDEEKIVQCISKYYVNVVVDNTKNENPQAIYEDDPNVVNLIGSIEYESNNGSYYTDASLINAGTLMKANSGCVIVRIDNLLAYPSSYYYLKKVLLNEKISIDYNKSYLELISLNRLNPDPVDVKVKVIIIGDYNSFNTLYNLDNDFKKIFKLKAEFKSYIEVNENNNNILNDMIKNFVDSNKTNILSSEAVKEIAKFLSRKAESRKKINLDYNEIDKLIMLSNYRSISSNRAVIEPEDIIKSAYLEDEIEKELRQMYKSKKLLFSVNSEKIGQINGLSVIDIGYLSFGRPIRITCTTYKGTGNIIDVQKESNLSGKVHSKSINILKGYINSTFESYGKLNVDFHICFEQLYGKLEGDSASVAEVVCMISSLSKMPIKQNIAVTGSINQFGEVQAIGGVNQKIEGFYKVCKELDNIDGKGVLVPESNSKDIILNKEIETAIKENKFHIYIMHDLNDALDVLMGNKDLSAGDIIQNAKVEAKKYKDSK